MRAVHCIHCSSEDVEFKADLLVGCCEHKSGEVWHCNTCGGDMVIQTVYSDDPAEADCPHQRQEQVGQACGGCKGCAHQCGNE